MTEVNTYDENQCPFQIVFLDKSDLPPPYWPRVNQRLYYKDRRTGEIKSGTVIKPGRFTFWFCFDSGHVKLDKSVIGKRLFRTDVEAQEYGKTDADLH